MSSSAACPADPQICRTELMPIPAEEASSRAALDHLERQLRRLAFDLHDGPLQSLSMAEAMLGRTARTHDQDALRAQVAAAEGLLLHARAEMRDIMRDLRPPALDAEGLGTMVAEYAKEFSAEVGITVSVAAEGEEAFVSPRTQVAVLRIVQECLTNARRHSGAQHVDIRLEFSQSSVTCIVEDDGSGFDAEKALATGSTAHWGLRNMAERAALVSGNLSIATAPGCGTVIRAWMPADTEWT